MPLDSMSSIMMHVFLNDTHLLCPGPMGDISVHAFVAAYDTTLDNSNLYGARYIPRNIISNAARDKTLKIQYPSWRAIRPSKWYILLSTHSFSMHITLVTTNALE